MRKSKLLTFNVVIAILNMILIGAFWFRFSAPVLASTAGFFPNPSESINSISCFLTMQANHYALLQVFLVVVSIVIALGAFWGYNEIKNNIEKKASAKIHEVVPGLVKESLEKLDRGEMLRLLFQDDQDAISKKNSLKQILKVVIEEDEGHDNE